MTLKRLLGWQGTTGCGIAVLVLAILPSNQAWAWGQTGHRIVGEIAQKRLSSKTRASIRKLIGNESLARAATFMDEVKSDPNRAYYGPLSSLHYINIPPGQTIDEMEHPAEGDALIGLQRYEAVLRDPAASHDKKAEALRFVVHLVGDIHQPLHANAPGDQGANWCYVKFFGATKNLHALWDEDMIDYLRLSFIEYARFLEEASTQKQRAGWAHGTYADWIVESNSESAQIYPQSVGKTSGNARTYCKTSSSDFIDDAQMPRLSYDYHYQWRPLLDRKLTEGGVRLALTLNRIFDPSSGRQSAQVQKKGQKEAARLPAAKTAPKKAH